MNSEENNLNGVVLGSVEQTPVNDVPQTPAPEPVITPVESQVVQPESVVMPQAPVGDQVINPVGSEVAKPEPAVMTPAEPVPAPSPAPVSPTPEVVTPSVTSAPQVEAVPTPQAGETKEFTSINNINPTPTTPGFDSSIGTNPPISLEASKEPKKKGNKTAFVVIIIILLVGVGLGTYYVLNYTDLLIKRESITVTTNNLTFNVGDELPDSISEYATISGTSASNCTFDISKVDVSTEGTYSYTVTCSNTEKQGVITIVDNALLAVITKTVYTVKGSTVKAKDFVKDPSDKITYSFVNEDEVKTALSGDLGTYTVKIKAVSNSKEVEVEAKLVLLSYKIKGYAVCSSKEQQITNAIMIESKKLAIADDGGSNAYGKVAFNVYKFKYSDETEYAKVVADYNEKGTITINSVTGDAEFDDATLTVTITKEIGNTELYGEYGEANMKDYVSIRSYFTDKLEYTCVYEKANG
jgi:hypothetical protein